MRQVVGASRYRPMRIPRRLARWRKGAVDILGDSFTCPLIVRFVRSCALRNRHDRQPSAMSPFTLGVGLGDTGLEPVTLRV